MKFGWRPKITHGTPPIPLYFDFLEHPYWEFKEIDTIVYYGFRPKTSFDLHEKFSNKTNSFGYQFTFPSHYKISQFKYEGAYEKLARFWDFNSNQEFVGMNPKLDCESLVFDSQFEWGNIDLVLKSGDRDNYYYWYIRPDTNSNGHLHWFYFSVTKAKVGQTVTLNIPNFTKYTSLFEQGLKPSVFSWQKYKNRKVGWHRSGQNIKYNKVVRQGRIFFSLEFDYKFEYDNDTVWFATSIPYSYSMLCKYIKSIENKVICNDTKNTVNFGNPLNKLKREYVNLNIKKNKKQNKIWEITELGKSLGGLSIPLIIITNFNWSKETMNNKRIVLMCSRVHPGETNASWITHGIIDYLLSDSPIAVELRNKVIFHIIPMINPDGVVAGNHRWSFLGKDINRWFERPNKQLEPEPFYVRKHLRKIVKEAYENGITDKILAFVDIHSHSNRKSIFMYGPHYPLHSSNYMNIRVIPKLMSERTTMFRFYSWKFRAEKYKENWARLSLWRGFNIQISLTIESSFHGFLDENRDTRVFNEANLQHFGQKFCQSILEYSLILEENHKQKIELAKKLSK